MTFQILFIPKILNMDKTIKYLKILEFKENKYKRIKNYTVLKYSFFRIQRFFKKIKKIKLILKKKFINEIKEMIFGYGDSKYPNKESMIFVENLIVNFVSIIVVKINAISFLKLSRRPLFEDILFIIRKDPSKAKRIIYLIKMKSIIEKLVKQTRNSNQIPHEIISRFKKN